MLYDRTTESVWYPFGSDEMTALSGPCAGTALPFLAEPEQVSLAEWRADHPDSLVLVGGE